MPSSSVRQPDERAKASEALALRRSGLSYREIATRLGHWSDESGARHAVTRLLDRTEAEGVAELRAVEGERLDALQAAHWDTAVAGDIDATKAVLGVIDRRMKLFGLSAPVAVDVGLGAVSNAQWSEEVADLIARLEVSTAVVGQLRTGTGVIGRKIAAAADGVDAAEPLAVTECDQPDITFHLASVAHRAESEIDDWSNIE